MITERSIAALIASTLAACACTEKRTNTKPPPSAEYFAARAKSGDTNETPPDRWVDRREHDAALWSAIDRLSCRTGDSSCIAYGLENWPRRGLSALELERLLRARTAFSLELYYSSCNREVGRSSAGALPAKETEPGATALAALGRSAWFRDAARIIVTCFESASEIKRCRTSPGAIALDRCERLARHFRDELRISADRFMLIQIAGDAATQNWDRPDSAQQRSHVAFIFPPVAR